MPEDKKTKHCPYCGEEILSIAKKCKFCGEYLEKDCSTIIYTKQDIKQIRDKINSFKNKDLPEKFKNNKEIKEELYKAADKCESIFDSIVTPGYRALWLTLGFVMFIILILAIGTGLSIGSFGSFVGSIIIGILIDLLIYLYFLPSYIAFRNGHKQAWFILIINIFFSGFLIPWISILIWALSNKNNEDIVDLEQSNRIRQEVLHICEKIENKIKKLCEN